VQFGKIRKLARILRCPPYRRALRSGVAATIEHERLLRLLDCRTIVDIGANRGQFALAAHTLIPGANIFSFEPLGQPAQKFREVFDGNKQVRLYQVAIGPDRCTADIHVSGREDSSSLLPITELKDELHPGTAEARIEQVHVERLAGVLTSADIIGPALLKLDVQGYELETLRGCLDLLQCFAYVYVECSFVEQYRGQAFADEVIAFLREVGFALAGIYNLCQDKNGRALEGDFFFVNSGSQRLKMTEELPMCADASDRI
jgi:FkbM family methyltransferase